jgi:putative NADH-flavin reductase
MNILLVGASGMIGSRILAEAERRGHAVVAAARNPEKIKTEGATRAVRLDANNGKAVADLARNADVIVLAASPRSTGDARKEANTLGDAAIAAAKDAGKRLFVVGGAGSLNLPDGTPIAETLPDIYRSEALGMRDVRDKLKKSDLDWTFFSPAAEIAPGSRTGKYRLGETTLLLDGEGKSRISAEDYADAALNEIETPKHRRGQFTAAY